MTNPSQQAIAPSKEINHLSVIEIAKIIGISRPTIYKILKEELNYISNNRLLKIQKSNLKNEDTN
jgi:transcriptional regulator with XRE-family HTH domain